MPLHKATREQVASIEYDARRVGDDSAATGTRRARLIFFVFPTPPIPITSSCMPLHYSIYSLHGACHPVHLPDLPSRSSVRRTRIAQTERTEPLPRAHRTGRSPDRADRRIGREPPGGHGRFRAAQGLFATLHAWWALLGRGRKSDGRRGPERILNGTSETSEEVVGCLLWREEQIVALSSNHLLHSYSPFPSRPSPTSTLCGRHHTHLRADPNEEESAPPKEHGRKLGPVFVDARRTDLPHDDNNNRQRTHTAWSTVDLASFDTR